MAAWSKLVDAKCKQCAYDPLDKGTWREQVENCGSVDCPLYPVRPVRFGKRGMFLAENSDNSQESEG